jgi:1,4-alpha-glucan branching enzyme
MRELGDRGIFDEDAFRRAKLAAVILMTTVGIPMLWMGEEFGEYQRKSEDVTQPKRINWSLLNNDQNQDLLDYYKKLIALRKQTSALQSDNIEFFHENPSARILAYVRWNDQGSRVAVIINFSANNLNYYQIPQFPTAETWRDFFTNDEITITYDSLVTDLPSYEAKVFVS